MIRLAILLFPTFANFCQVAPKLMIFITLAWQYFCLNFCQRISLLYSKIFLPCAHE